MRFRRRALALCLGILVAAATFAAAWWAVARWAGARPVASVLAGRVVVIDPGHGGRDPGVTRKGKREKDINLAVGLLLRDLLRRAGAGIVMTRETDADFTPDDAERGTKKRWDLAGRADVANASGADAFVSLHVNSIPGGGARGAQVFYQKERADSRRLAEYLQQEFARLGPTQHRRAVGVERRIYLMRAVRIPAVTIELGFLTAPQEFALLDDPQYQRRLAWAIFRGLVAFFSAEAEAAGRQEPVGQQERQGIRGEGP